MRLSPRVDQIELDQITILVEYIQTTFVDYFGVDANVNAWDTVRIKNEFEEIFDADAFQRLFSTEFGRGVLVGAWAEAFIFSEEEASEN